MQAKLASLSVSEQDILSFKAITDQLKDLRNAGEQLKLEESLQLDPLRKQIKDMADTTKELTFDEIVRSANEARAKIASLESQLGSANVVVADNESKVTAAQIALDNITNQTALYEVAVKTAQDALDKATAGTKLYEDKVKAAELVVRAASDALKEQRKTIEIQREELDRLRDSLDLVQSAYQREVDKLNDAKAAYREVNSAIQTYKQSLLEVEREANRIATERKAAADKAKDSVLEGAGKVGGSGLTQEEIDAMNAKAEAFQVEMTNMLWSLNTNMAGWGGAIDSIKISLTDVKLSVDEFNSSVDKLNEKLKITGLSFNTKFFERIGEIADIVSIGWAKVTKEFEGFDEVMTRIKSKIPEQQTDEDFLKSIGLGAFDAAKKNIEDFMIFIQLMARHVRAFITITTALSFGDFATALEEAKRVIDLDIQDITKQFDKSNKEIEGFVTDSINQVATFKDKSTEDLSDLKDDKSIFDFAGTTKEIMKEWSLYNIDQVATFKNDSLENINDLKGDPSLLGWASTTKEIMEDWSIYNIDQVATFKDESIKDLDTVENDKSMFDFADKTKSTIRDWSIYNIDQVSTFKDKSIENLDAVESDKSIFDFAGSTKKIMENWAIENIDQVATFKKDSIDHIDTFKSDSDETFDDWKFSSVTKTIAWSKAVNDQLTEENKSLYQKMLDIGENIVHGFGEGINKATQWLKDKIQELFNSIATWAKEKLGIKSPSTVFESIGANIVLGLASGIASSMPALMAQMARIQEVTTGQMNLSMTGSSVPTSARHAEITRYPSSVTNRNTTYQVNANYSQLQSAASIVQDMRALVELSSGRGY